MCIFLVTHKDGTLFEDSSITEEDTVQLCMTLGHTHPLGVLHYPATDLVVLFCMAEEMLRASHGAIKATELHNKPIAIKILAPTEPHVKAYISVGGGYPLNCNLHLQMMRRMLIPQLVTLTRVGVCHDTSRQSLETSQTGNCGNLWRISDERLHFTSYTHPPAILNPLPRVNPQGAEILMRMTWRSPSQEGEGGFP